MKKIKCYLSILLVLSIMICSTSMFTVNAAQVTETDDVVIYTEANLDGEDELQPTVTSNCPIPTAPSIAYTAYNIITNHNGADFYTHHAYDNISYPRLPGGTTYTTYYLTNSGSDQQRLVIGADGSAYYSPYHYTSWIKL